MLSDDTNSLRHLPRRSSKNCDLQFANFDRFMENNSIDIAGKVAYIITGYMIRELLPLTLDERIVMMPKLSRCFPKVGGKKTFSNKNEGENHVATW